MNRPVEQAHALRDLGVIYSERGDKQAALQEWTAALQLYESEKQHAHSARLRCDIGNARRALGQGQRALKDYEHALMSLSAVNDFETRGVVLSNAAIAYAEQGDVESADDFFAEAINIAHRLGDVRAESTRRGNHGWFMIITGRARRATGALEQALRLSRQADSHLQVAVQTDNLGLAHGEYEVARHYHEQALELIAPLNQPHWEALFKTHYASVLLALGESDRALVLLDVALAFGRSANDADVLTRALLAQARLLLHAQGDIPRAGEALSEALALARRAEQRHLLAEALALSSEQHAAAGQHARAVALWGEAQRLYTILHSPQAKVQPAWLAVEASSSQ
jgi:tetratricopeptide (TPR) repeat protein